MQATDFARRIPRQARAQATIDIVLDAAAQLLERDGERGFNTNAVAERAGVSIGTLYRYFADKRAVLAALAERETRAHHAAMAAVRAGDFGGTTPDRAMIRAFTQAFGGRSEARRVAMTAWLAQADPRELAAGHAPVEAGFVDSEGRALSPVASFVLSRALLGAMRAAVLEGADFLTSQEFEDELVRLGRAYLAAPRSSRRSSGGPAGGSRSGSSPGSGRGSGR